MAAARSPAVVPHWFRPNDVALAMLAFAILPNAPYFLWLDRFSPTRGLVNVDYLLLGALSIFLSPLAITVVFVLLAIVDAFVFISTLYHFAPRELVASIVYARYSPISIFDLPIVDIGLMLVTLGIAVMCARRVSAGRRRSVPVAMAVLIVLVALADILNGSNTYEPFTRLPFYTRIQHIAVNPANSGVFAADPAAFLPWARKPSVTKVGSAAQIGLRELRGSSAHIAPKVNVAIVLVESWGRIAGSEALTQAIAAPLLTPTIARRYRVKIGLVPFNGSTTNAELRELCGVQANYRDLFDLPRLHCLTDRFAELGYTVTGLHGFYGDMFDRRSWWPRIGIRHRVFLDDFRKSGQTGVCGTAFPGLCDDALIAAVGNRLTRDRQFVYALTINSHLPLPRVADADGAFRCSTLPIALHDEPCGLAQAWRRVFTAVANIALREDIRPTQFIVVGDHSPPLVSAGERGFDPTNVPYIVLTPR